MKFIYTRRFVAASLAMLLVLIFTQIALAAEIEIDHFASGDPVSVSATNATSSAFGVGSGITALGGERDLILTSTGGTSNAIINPLNHVLDFNTGPGVTDAILEIQYDGVDASTVLNRNGLMPQLMQDGANLGFHIQVLKNTNVLAFTLQAYSDDTHWSTSTITIPANITPPAHVDFMMRWSSFANGAGAVGPADFTAITAVVLRAHTGSPNSQFLLDFVEASNKQDHGDLPASYGDAAHLTVSPRLGANEDSESSSHNTDSGHTLDAMGDDLETGGNIPDDEDGVAPTPGISWAPGTNGGSLDITVNDCTGSCFINAWIDWDQLGTMDAGEKILNDRAVSNGTQTVTFNVPDGTTFNTIYAARIRLYKETTGGTAQPTGDAINGEVEDYLWSFSPTAVTLSQFAARSSTSGSIFIYLAIVGLALVGILIVSLKLPRNKQIN